MQPTTTSECFRGTVQSFDDRAGYGYIQPDEGQGIEDLLLVHRNSLRQRGAAPNEGDRVLFRTKPVPTGLLATDVHAELVDEAAQPDAEEWASGTIISQHKRGFGFIRLLDGREAFFHVSYFTDSNFLPSEGTGVNCRVVNTEKGLQAQDIGTDKEPDSEAICVDATPPSAVAPHRAVVSSADGDLLAQAIIARDNRQYSRAAILYEKGLTQSPSVGLVLSYAAMQKNINQKSAAMRTYEKGIELFGTNAKLREDAGILAARLGDRARAVRLLEESLELSRRTGQGGQKGVLLALARIHYERGAAGSLKEAIRRYDEALQLFGRGRTQLPADDLLSMNIAKIRMQHQRGNLTFEFFRRINFKVIRARLLDQVTHGAEFVVEIDNPELLEGYGIGRHVVARCMFKADVTLSDLEALDASVTAWANSGLGDEQLALMVVSSLPDDLQRLLSRRIEDRKRMLPAIVPIQQSEIETKIEPRTTLQSVLDRWLYRRDLFAGNSPVVGRRFFGRGKPLAEIRDAVATSTPTAIFGLRKVGKTSLLQESQRRSAEAGDIVVYLDLLRVPSDISDCRWLYWKLATELKAGLANLSLRNFRWRLGGEFNDFLDIPDSFKVATAFDSDLTRLLRELRTLRVAPRPKIVFFLDEVERLLPTALGKAGFTGFFDFFSYLRGVSQENSNFVVVITGANAIITEAAQFERRDNPIFNFFKEVYLQFLEPSECDLMIRELGRGMGLRFTSNATEYVYSLTGGHPFFARQLCSFVAEHYRDRPLHVDAEKITGLVDRYLDTRSSDFREIIERLERDFPEELEVCMKLAKGNGELPISSLENRASVRIGSAIRHLTGYQIVGVKGRSAFLTVDLLARWLRKRYVPDHAR